MRQSWDQGGIWNSGAYGRLGRVRGSGDIWRYVRDIIVQGDWEDRDDDFTFRNDK